MTHRNLITAVLAATISLCGSSASAQQFTPTANRTQDVAPAISPQQLRESLSTFARNSQQARELSAPSAATASDGELVFKKLPKIIPASSPLADVSPSAPIESFGPVSVLAPTDAFPELPSISTLGGREPESHEPSVPPYPETLPQPVSVGVNNPIQREAIEVPDSALSVPTGLRVPDGLLQLPSTNFGAATPALENLTSAAAAQSQPIVPQSVAPESLALPAGISLPLAETLVGDGQGVAQQLPPSPQPATVSGPAALPNAIEGGSLQPRAIGPDSVESLSLANESFSALQTQPVAGPQGLVASPSAYGFQEPQLVAAALGSAASVSQTPVSQTPVSQTPVSVLDSATLPQNPVLSNTYPAQYQQFASAPGSGSGWQAPFTPTPGHNERNHITRDLSLSPPPITGRPLTEYLPIQPPSFQPTDFTPKFDPQAGHRAEQPIRRFDSYSLNDGDKFDFETKKRDFPPFGEIIATGRFFFMAEALWAEPQFQGNTLIATDSPGFGESLAGDFDSDFHPRFRFGFESPYGPGIEFTYFNINSNSELASFTSDGITSGQTSASILGLDRLSSVIADDFGEQLVTQHSLDIDSFTVSFFKELKFPISRVNGNFGFQYVSVAQELNANVSGGATAETLRSVTDLRAFGPRAIIEYYRPIGHTPLELVTTFGGAVLFGQRDQFVTNSEDGALTRSGADEFLTILDFFVGVQYTKNVGENRAWYGRGGFLNQTWLGGGSASIPQGDFGLRGFTFGIGYNR